MAHHRRDLVRGEPHAGEELGFFFGRLGRGRVAVVYEPEVEKPSDIDGFVYIESGDWLALLRELKSAGLDYDLNALA